MKKVNFFIKTILLSGVLLLASCSNDDNDQPKGDYENGILISGEGSGAGDGSISYISDDYNTIESKIYSNVNNSTLGTYLQSMAFDDDNAYIVVDDQNTVTVVDRYTFESLGQITEGLLAPRYMAIDGDKGYVTNWGTGSFGNNIDDDFISVINLNTLEVEARIDVEVGPERIVVNNGKLFVSHEGAHGDNNKVSVIDIVTREVEKVIVVRNKPDELIFDSQGNLLVLCSGKPAWTGDETLGAISKIDLLDYSVTEITFPEGDHPSLMVVENNTIYYSLGNKVYKMGVSETVLPTNEFLIVELFTEGFPLFYGMEVKNGILYALNTSFSDVSEMQVFNLSDQQKINTIEAPIGASKIYFN